MSQHCIRTVLFDESCLLNTTCLNSELCQGSNKSTCTWKNIKIRICQSLLHEISSLKISAEELFLLELIFFCRKIFLFRSDILPQGRKSRRGVCPKSILVMASFPAPGKGWLHFSISDCWMWWSWSFFQTAQFYDLCQSYILAPYLRQSWTIASSNISTSPAAKKNV